jgi:Tol biopolymer transport system component
MIAPRHTPQLRSGVLVWRTGIGPNVNRLIWFDTNGREVGAVGQPADYSNPALSPDGKRLAVDVREPITRKRDIWVFDLERGSTARFTNNPADDFNAVWSPDGRQIAFTSDRKGTRAVYVKPADAGA